MNIVVHPDVLLYVRFQPTTRFGINSKSASRETRAGDRHKNSARVRTGHHLSRAGETTAGTVLARLMLDRERTRSLWGLGLADEVTVKPSQAPHARRINKDLAVA
jgi:hypothetical protein